MEKILEEYPHDLRGRSCIVYGKSGLTHIHVVCGKNKVGHLVLITVYTPSMPKWKTPVERNK